MINHFITLVRILAEGESRLGGHRLRSIHSFRKNEILFSFDGATRLSVFLYPSRPFIFFETESPLPSKNTVSLFPEYWDLPVISFSLHQSDRVFRLELAEGRQIDIALFSASSGITFRENGQVSGSIKNEWIPPESDYFLSFQDQLKNTKVLFNSVRFHPALEQTFGMNEPLFFSALSDLNRAGVFYIYTFNNRSVLSPISLPGFTPVQESSAGSVFLKQVVLSQLREARFTQEKKSAHSLVSQKIRKVSQTIFQINGYLSKEEDLGSYKIYGDLLMAAENPEKTGLQSLTLKNWFSGNQEEITIPLDPSLSLTQNAREWYRKVKNFKALQEEKLMLMENKRKELSGLNSLLEQISASHTPQELSEIRKRNKGVFSDTQKSDSSGSEPFHRVLSKYGYELFIGKHARGNDFLLTSVARKNDLWFHIRGDSGSMVILPCRSKETPGKEKIEEAAAFAAFFSGQRKSDWVPVSWTQVKYIRKVKGDVPGRVFMEREEVVFVKPVSPPKSN